MMIQFSFFLFSLILLICVFFIPVFQDNANDSSFGDGDIIDFNPNGFVWPLPGYTKISSPFGKRPAPTGGASSFHYGADIPAPPETYFIAVHDGEITFRQFLGAGGYTITLSFNSFKVTYCHVDPHFIVSVGDQIKQGQVIGSVGPRNVYGVPGNPYHDENGNPTNGATTGPHLHLGMRIDGEYVNPLLYF